MYPERLPKNETRAYRWIGGVGLVVWLSGGALALTTFGLSSSWFFNPWLWLSLSGLLVALIFGMAVELQNHVWPVCLLFHEN